MLSIIALIGTASATFSVIGNDCVQTLSTFIQSCRSRSASVWLMSAFLCAIFVATISYGFFIQGDAAFGRLTSIPYTTPEWYHLLPLVILVALTYFGIPVSTTFIVLSTFSSSTVMLKMIEKSVFGGALAFMIGLLIWSILVRFFDERKDFIPEKYAPYLIGVQALATGALLVSWITHDIANILVFLPRGTQMGLPIFVALCVGACCVLTSIVYFSGGKIQKIVANKSGTNYVFSAILIDLFYAFILFFLKGYSHIPMSTTWAFIGLILGRECAMLFYHESSLKNFWSIAQKDLLKLLIGGVVSISAVEIIQYLN